MIDVVCIPGKIFNLYAVQCYFGHGAKSELSTCFSFIFKGNSKAGLFNMVIHCTNWSTFVPIWPDRKSDFSPGCMHVKSRIYVRSIFNFEYTKEDRVEYHAQCGNDFHLVLLNLNRMEIFGDQVLLEYRTRLIF